MEFEGKSRRLRERMRLSMPVRVECRESADFRWTEMSRLIDVTPFGARFALVHMTEPGRLVHLTLPMPRQLRCYDHVEPQYKVWALVRNVGPHRPPRGARAAAQDELPRYEIGVAFVGKRPPPSYEQDPSTRYDIQNLTPTECSYALTEKEPPAFDPSAPRTQETRLMMPLDVLVEAFDETGAPVLREQTVTENISRRGASVWTTLPVERGRFVRLTSLAQRLSVMAAVRARRAGPDGVTRLHLEFIEREWPLEGLE